MNAFILDTETDSKVAPRVIQLAYINLADGSEFMQLYNSGRKICPATMAIHHISNEDVAEKTMFYPASLPKIDYLIGHNIDYDWRVIGEPNCKKICTLALVRSLFPEWTGHSLGACIYHILPAHEAKKLTKNAHDALADVQANLALYQHICQSLNIAENNYEAVWKTSENARTPKKMPFGKHKGVPFSEIPQNYLHWATQNLTDIDEYLRKALINAIIN